MPVERSLEGMRLAGLGILFLSHSSSLKLATKPRVCLYRKFKQKEEQLADKLSGSHNQAVSASDLF